MLNPHTVKPSPPITSTAGLQQQTTNYDPNNFTMPSLRHAISTPQTEQNNDNNNTNAVVVVVTTTSNCFDKFTTTSSSQMHHNDTDTNNNNNNNNNSPTTNDDQRRPTTNDQRPTTYAKRQTPTNDDRRTAAAPREVYLTTHQRNDATTQRRNDATTQRRNDATTQRRNVVVATTNDAKSSYGNSVIRSTAVPHFSTVCTVKSEFRTHRRREPRTHHPTVTSLVVADRWEIRGSPVYRIVHSHSLTL